MDSVVSSCIGIRLWPLSHFSVLIVAEVIISALWLIRYSGGCYRHSGSRAVISRLAPHAIGKNGISSDNEEQSESRRVVGQDEGKSVHAGVEHRRSLDGSARPIVEPGQNDDQRNHRSNAQLDVHHQREPNRAEIIEGSMP